MKFFYRTPETFHAAFHPLFRSLRHCTDAESLRRRVYRQKCNPGFSGHRHRLPPPRLSAQQRPEPDSFHLGSDRPHRHTAAAVPYGSLYEKSDLDDALRSRDPLSVVPVTDPDGHGTYVAGVAGGTPNASAGFLGAAPEADFAVVKLKPAKQNLKDFYLVSTNAPVFEEDDLLSAMRFLNEVAAREGKPLVICLALGTNQGSHSGTFPSALTLARYGNTPGIIPVCATGNEGNAAHHYYGSVSENDSPKNVEFLVSEGSRGFVLEFWGQVPQLFSVGFRSPGGETIPRIPVSLTQEQRITFVLERTVIYVNYEVVQTTTGSQLILIRMLDPTPGI